MQDKPNTQNVQGTASLLLQSARGLQVLALRGERSSPVRLVVAVIHEGAVGRAAERARQPRMLAKVCSLRPTPGPDALPTAVRSALWHASSARAVEADKSHRQNKNVCLHWPCHKALPFSSSSCRLLGKSSAHLDTEAMETGVQECLSFWTGLSKQTLQTVLATIRRPCHRPAASDEPCASPTLLPDSRMQPINQACCKKGSSTLQPGEILYQEFLPGASTQMI